MTTGFVVLLLATVSAAGFAAYRARVDGNFAEPAPAPVAEDTPTGASIPVVEVRGRPAPEPRNLRAWDSIASVLPTEELGERATFVQFSSAFCAPCRTTRVLLSDVAAHVDGVHHVEVDAEQHLDLVRRLGVQRTPTTVVLDAAGHEVTRAAGAPQRHQILAALPATSGG